MVNLKIKKCRGAMQLAAGNPLTIGNSLHIGLGLPLFVPAAEAKNM